MVTTQTTPYTPLTDLQEARIRHRHAQHLLTSHPTTRTPLDTPARAAIRTALDHIPALCDESEQLRTLLHAARLDLANLIAAARATLTAHHDGERDPLYYLRDELSAQSAQDTPPARQFRRHPYGGETR